MEQFISFEFTTRGHSIQFKGSRTEKSIEREHGAEQTEFSHDFCCFNDSGHPDEPDGTEEMPPIDHRLHRVRIRFLKGRKAWEKWGHGLLIGLESRAKKLLESFFLTSDHKRIVG